MLITAMTGGKILPDVESLAAHLDIAKEEYGSMLWIAEAALQAPLPSGWMENSNPKGEVCLQTYAHI